MKHKPTTPRDQMAALCGLLRISDDDYRAYMRSYDELFVDSPENTRADYEAGVPLKGYPQGSSNELTELYKVIHLLCTLGSVVKMYMPPTIDPEESVLQNQICSPSTGTAWDRNPDSPTSRRSPGHPTSDTPGRRRHGRGSPWAAAIGRSGVEDDPLDGDPHPDGAGSVGGDRHVEGLERGRAQDLVRASARDQGAESDHLGPVGVAEPLRDPAVGVGRQARLPSGSPLTPTSLRESRRGSVPVLFRVVERVPVHAADHWIYCRTS